MKNKATQRNAHRQAAQPAPIVTRRGLLLILIAVGVCLATWALFEFVIWSQLPSRLVGKWSVVSGPAEYEGAVFDFYRNGTMEGRVNLKGDLGIIKAKVRVEGDKIHSTSKHPKTGEEKTQVQIIRSLTDTELVVEDEQGKLMKLQRATP